MKRMNLKINMKPSFLIILTLIVITAGFSAHAETMQITLDQAIAWGLQYSATIEAKKIAVQSSETQVQSAKSGRYPVVTAGINYAHLFSPNKSPNIDLGGGNEFPGSYFLPNDSVMLTADINQPIYTFGRIKDGIRLAQEGMKLSQLELDEEQRSFIVNIKRAFYGYILAKEVLKVHEETLAQKEEAYEIAKARLDAGLVAKFVVLSSESDLEGFKPEIISSTNQVDLALLAVKDLLNIGQTGDIEIDLIGKLEPIPLSYSREEAIDRAMENNYFLKQYRSFIMLSEYEERFKQSEKKPIIGGFASYTVNNTFNSSTGKANFFGSGSWEDLITVGVGMQVPISAQFNWSMEGADRRKAELDLRQIRTEQEVLENSIRLGIDSILLRLNEEDAKIRSTSKNVELASTLYESARVQFANGLISRLELKEVQLMLNSARLAHLLSVYNQNLAAYDLADAIGINEF